MANRPAGYGLTAEVRHKMIQKYNDNTEREAVAWMGEVLREPELFKGVQGADKVHEKLKDGVILCRVFNVIEPGAIQFSTKKQPFLMMENIGKFLNACKDYGVAATDLFQTVDLYEKENMASVINAIYALARKANSKGFFGPALGPRESQSNVRIFSQQQMNDGKSVISLQYGSNKGATQQGMRFGKSREIIFQ